MTGLWVISLAIVLGIPDGIWASVTHLAFITAVASVAVVTTAGFVTPDERAVVFDNDGTLWSEEPIPIQLDFTFVPAGGAGFVAEGTATP